MPEGSLSNSRTSLIMPHFLFAGVRAGVVPALCQCSASRVTRQKLRSDRDCRSKGAPVERARKEFREAKGLPEALQVGEDHFDIAAELPEELPAGAAG